MKIAKGKQWAMGKSIFSSIFVFDLKFKNAHLGTEDVDAVAETVIVDVAEMVSVTVELTDTVLHELWREKRVVFGNAGFAQE